MVSYIIEYQNSITDLLCDEIIEKYNESNSQYLLAARTFSGINKNILDAVDLNVSIDSEPEWEKKIFTFLTKELYKKIKFYLNIVNKHTECIDQASLFIRSFLIRKYKKGAGKYIYHTDSKIFFNTTSNRVITFIWYLNDIEIGGETIFNDNYKIKPEKGKLLLFPSTFSYPHTGSIPITDDKYVIVGWVEEKINEPL